MAICDEVQQSANIIIAVQDEQMLLEAGTCPAEKTA